MILSGYVSEAQTHIQQSLVNEEEPLAVNQCSIYLLLNYIQLEYQVHAVQYDKFYPSFRENTQNILHEIIIYLFISYQEIYLMELEEITFNDLLNYIKP